MFAHSGFRMWNNWIFMVSLLTRAWEFIRFIGFWSLFLESFMISWWWGIVGVFQHLSVFVHLEWCKFVMVWRMRLTRSFTEGSRGLKNAPSWIQIEVKYLSVKSLYCERQAQESVRFWLRDWLDCLLHFLKKLEKIYIFKIKYQLHLTPLPKSFNQFTKKSNSTNLWPINRYR